MSIIKIMFRMYLRLYFFTLALSFITKVQCQVIYTKQSQSHNWFYDIFQEKGTPNFLFSNSNFTFNPSTNTFRNTTEIVKISPNGNLISSKQLDTNFSYYQILRVNANYFILGEQIVNYSQGNSSHLIEVVKYDLNFNPIKKSVIDSFYNRDPAVIKLISNQNRLYLGYKINEFSDTFNLFKLDLNLNKLDSNKFNKGFLYDIDNLGNNLVLCGSSFFQNSQYPVNKIAKMDTSFNLIWQYHLDSLSLLNTNCGIFYPKIELNTSHVIGLDSNRYFVRGNEFAFDSNCNFNLRTASAFISGNKNINKLHLIGNDSLHTMCSGGYASSSMRYNSIYTSAETGYDNLNPFPPQSNNTRILLTKMDTAGNLLWVNYFGGDKYYLPQSIHATSDSGVVICGMRYDHEIPQVDDVCEGFVLKLSKNGQVEVVGITENGKLNMNYHKCFPNPAKEAVFFDLPLQQKVEIRVFDDSGRLVIKTENYQNLSALNIAALKPGTYVYKINTQLNNYSGKFVKE
jgi:hypothetical protein